MCIEAANEINNDVGTESAFSIPANISDESQLKFLWKKQRKAWKIDVLVCNAATNPFMGSMLDMPTEKSIK